MKTNKILVMALLLGFAGAGFTSCAIKDNEKKGYRLPQNTISTVRWWMQTETICRA